MSRPNESLAEDAIAKRLDRSWFSARHDDHLDVLVILGEAGVPVALGVLVDGAIVRGIIGPHGQLTEAASRAIQRAVEAFYPGWPEDQKSAAIDALRQRDASNEERNSRAQEVFDRYYDETNGSLTIDEVRLEDVPSVTRVASPRHMLAFQQATLQVAGAPPIEVGSLQISRSAISAWWPLDEEVGSAVNYQSPS